MAIMNFDNVVKSIGVKSQTALICTNKPLLHEIEVMYRHETVIDLLYAYLFKFQTLLNIKDEYKMNSDQMLICSRNLLPLLRGLTIAEIVDMFCRFLSGEFGVFYGNLDMMIIGKWVREFKRKRSDLILKNREVRKFTIKRDQNYNVDRVTWLEENKTEQND